MLRGAQDSPGMVTRRAALFGLGVAAAGGALGPVIAETVGGDAVAATGVGPTFSATGPDAALYGAADGFPVPGFWARRQGNPYAPKYRVGAFSHFDEVLTTRPIARAAAPWAFKRSPAELRYVHRGGPSSVTDYLSRNPVTGLLIARDDEILVEHYQYGRTDRDRMLSQSMVKSIMGMLIGIAVSEGAISSVDDTPQAYVPGFKGTEYGGTRLRDLLHMASGVEFREDEDNGRDLNRLWNDMVRGSWIAPKGTIGSITQFNRRIAAPGTRYFYASIEPDVLGVVLRNAVGMSASDYLRRKLWEPIGAEADASWLVDAEGGEVAHFGFNAALRDYARLGRLLAHDGAWQGQAIIPASWMIDATTVRASDAFLSPGKAMPNFGYGYLLWLLPGTRRQFAMVGYKGQRVIIDPASKLVLVQTALEDGDEVWRLWAAAVAQFGQG
jgi:CubicO group peptidase (beta-lactamase class C family)